MKHTGTVYSVFYTANSTDTKTIRDSLSKSRQIKKAKQKNHSTINSYSANGFKVGPVIWSAKTAFIYTIQTHAIKKRASQNWVFLSFYFHGYAFNRHFLFHFRFFFFSSYCLSHPILAICNPCRNRNIFNRFEPSDFARF